MNNNKTTPTNGTTVTRETTQEPTSEDRYLFDKVLLEVVQNIDIDLISSLYTYDSNISIEKPRRYFINLEEGHDFFLKRKNARKFKVKGKIRSITKPTPKPKL